MTASTEVNQEQEDPNQAVQVALQAGEEVPGDRQEGEGRQADNLEGEEVQGDHQEGKGRQVDRVVEGVPVAVAVLRVLDQEALVAAVV